jgi:hypothetical protein
MNRYYHAVRYPVRRPRAEEYLLLSLLSFALSVSLTRLFLALTGYPQLGGGILHISHVLWGGLLLFIAAMLPLVLANRWVYRVVAILAGVGIGLFIDEVGKFITQSYDYFFPPAAPIIYAFFLICVLIYLQFAHPRPRFTRSELYAAIEAMEEVLDHDLDAQEQAEIKNRLTYVIEHEENPNLIRLASELRDYFSSDQLHLAPDLPSRVQRLSIWFQKIEARFFNRGRLRNLLVVGLGTLGLFSLIIPLFALISVVVLNGSIESDETQWVVMLGSLLGITGLALIFGAGFLFTGKEHLGIQIGYYLLLVYLTIVDIFLFYYYQFGMILVVLIQFVILLGLLYYQERYLKTN